MVKKKKQKVRFHRGDRKPGPALTKKLKYKINTLKRKSLTLDFPKEENSKRDQISMKLQMYLRKLMRINALNNKTISFEF